MFVGRAGNTPVDVVVLVQSALKGHPADRHGRAEVITAAAAASVASAMTCLPSRDRRGGPGGRVWTRSGDLVEVSHERSHAGRGKLVGRMYRRTGSPSGQQARESTARRHMTSSSERLRASSSRMSPHTALSVDHM